MRTRSKLKLITIIAAILVFVSLVCFALLFNKNSYSPDVYELDDDAMELVVNPAEEYVLAALNMTESVIDTTVDSSGEDGYVAKVYFVSSFLKNRQDGKVSTENGGSVEIFKTHDEALRRDEYLQMFSSDALSGQSHAVVGSLVVRTSQLLDAYNQRYLTDRVVHALTSGEITKQGAEQVMKDYLKDKTGMIEMTFSSDEVMSLNYADVKTKFDELGFTNVEYTVSEMNYSSETEFSGDVISVSVDGNESFDVGDSFKYDVPVIIGYVSDERVAVPMSSEECEGAQYHEIVSAFTSAGFLNVETAPFETEYNESDADGSVIAVVINETAKFEKGDKFSSKDTVIVNYVVLLPKGSKTSHVSSDTTTTTKSHSASEKATTAASDNTMVWIPVNGGSKYHSKASCSNMKNPQRVTISAAKSQGYSPCKRCN